MNGTWKEILIALINILPRLLRAIKRGSKKARNKITGS